MQELSKVDQELLECDGCEYLKCFSLQCQERGGKPEIYIFHENEVATWCHQCRSYGTIGCTLKKGELCLRKNKIIGE
ncbi:MAG: hypothetical protein ACFFCI_01070 [Promethearchaeota archaeon]